MEKQGSNTWMDCQYLVEANEALHECRYALRYTYVYAFYLDKTSNLKASPVDSKLATHAQAFAQPMTHAQAFAQPMRVVFCRQTSRCSSPSWNGRRRS